MGVRLRDSPDHLAAILAVARVGGIVLPLDWRSALPEALTARGDVTFFEQVAWGVAKSRNLVLDSTTTEYLLFADDDVEFDWAGILEGVALLDADPGADMLLAAARDEHGRLRKAYPSSVVPLSVRNSGKAATYEMLVRVPAVRARGIRFDERFGAGAVNYLGDEYIFCADLLRAGGRGLQLGNFRTQQLHGCGPVGGHHQHRRSVKAAFRAMFPVHNPAGGGPSVVVPAFRGRLNRFAAAVNGVNAVPGM